MPIFIAHITSMYTLYTGGRHQPYYHVLVDHRDRPFQSTYVAQENIVRSGVGEASSSGQVKHQAANEAIVVVGSVEYDFAHIAFNR